MSDVYTLNELKFDVRCPLLRIVDGLYVYVRLGNSSTASGVVTRGDSRLKQKFFYLEYYLEVR